MTEESGQNFNQKRGADRASKIAQLQQPIDEGLAGGISELTMDDIRKLARNQVAPRRFKWVA